MYFLLVSSLCILRLNSETTKRKRPGHFLTAFRQSNGGARTTEELPTPRYNLPR